MAGLAFGVSAALAQRGSSEPVSYSATGFQACRIKKPPTVPTQIKMVQNQPEAVARESDQAPNKASASEMEQTQSVSDSLFGDFASTWDRLSNQKN